MTATFDLSTMTGQLLTHEAPAPVVVPKPRSRPLVPTEQELDCQDDYRRVIRLHIVVGDRGRVGLRIAGRSSVLWLDGGGNALAEGIRSALAERHSRPEVRCSDEAGKPQVIRLGATPHRRIGVLIPGQRSALWLADAAAVAWAARRAQTEARHRATHHTPPPPRPAPDVPMPTTYTGVHGDQSRS